VSIVSVSDQPPCQPATGGLQGWHFQSPLPDGGEIAGPSGWPTAYVQQSFQVSTTATSTSPLGYGVIYDIDAAVDTVTVFVDGGPPGAICPSSNLAFGFDGLVHVAPGTFGLFPYIIP
jgi:hypothetical protein